MCQRILVNVIGSIALASTAFAGTLLAGDSGQSRDKAEPRGARPRLGINLAGAADWSSEQPFVDVFRLSREWISQRRGAPWGQGPKLALDAHGWVKQLEDGCYAETLLCTLEPGRHYPGGVYTVFYIGQGTLDASGAATVIERQPGRLKLRVDPTKGGFFLRITATDPSDPLREIRVVMPGYEETYRENPWRRDFLDRWQGMACLRFMDLMQTNGSPLVNWSERPTPDVAAYTVKGVPIEPLIDLANRLHTDPWFCIPHRADDDYVRNCARLIKDRLLPDLKVYVEYSNEVWNGRFQQSQYAGEQGQRLGFAEKPWEAAWKYTAHRSVAIFKVFEDVFGGHDRLVRVLGSQAANAYVAEQIVTFHDAYRHADALAIAPYLSLNVLPDGKPSVAEVAQWDVKKVLDYLEKTSLPESTRWIRDNQQVARKYGLKLVAYEAGQHMVGVLGGENDETLARLLTAANRDPRMAAIYDRYFAAWEREGGELLCYFSSVGPYTKWGSWGLFEYTDDNPARAPKYQSLVNWGRSLGQAVKITGPTR